MSKPKSKRKHAIPFCVENPDGSPLFYAVHWRLPTDEEFTRAQRLAFASPRADEIVPVVFVDPSLDTAARRSSLQARILRKLASTKHAPPRQ
jgi:hypothetical protein